MRQTAWTLARDAGLPQPQRVTAEDAGAIEGALLEVAWEGQPLVCARSGDDARVFGEGMRDWSDPFAPLAASLRMLAPSTLVLVGCACVFDEAGRPSFEKLKDWVAGARSGALLLVVTDALRLGEEDLRELPLSERRARLGPLLADAPSSLVESVPLVGSLADVRATAAKMGLPGVAVRALASRHPPEDGESVLVSSTDTPLEGARTLSPSPRVTNAAKLMFPRDGLSKADVARYYDDVAPLLLAHMRGRPIVAQRWPDGIDDFTWYQHRVPPRAPDYLKPAMIDGDRRLLIDGRDSLLWMVNQAALTFHGWSSRVGSLDSPDWVVLDLDPGERTTWKHVIDVALAVRKLLELLEVESVVKTSGKKGLHVLVPLGPGQTMALAQTFAQRVALMIARLLPDVVTLESEIERRGGRLYFDHLNFKAKSLVLPYSLRDADGAPASAPLEWAEVTERLDPRAFNLSTLRARLDAKGDLFARALSGGADLAHMVAKLG